MCQTYDMTAFYGSCFFSKFVVRFIESCFGHSSKLLSPTSEWHCTSVVRKHFELLPGLFLFVLRGYMFYLSLSVMDRKLCKREDEGTHYSVLSSRHMLFLELPL